MVKSNGRDGSFASDMSSLLESGEGADVTLVVGDLQLPAHTPVLTARSPVFAAMLRNNMKEASSRRIEITDMRQAGLRQLLRFMYTDTAPELASVAAELLPAADKYDLPLLKKMCEEKLSQGLSVDNAATTATLAVLHACPGLENTAVDFIASHPEAMATDGWLNLLQGNPESAAHICSLVVAATTKNPPENRALRLEQTKELAEKLTEAAKTGEVHELERLLAAGAPADARDGSGSSALHLAVRTAGKGMTMYESVECAVETVKCLLNAGANVNAQDSSRQTPLHAAAYRGVCQIAYTLLMASAKLDVRDRWGKTPLHWAVAARKQDMVRLLLIAGADEAIRDCKGFRPQDSATKSIKEIFYCY